MGRLSVGYAYEYNALGAGMSRINLVLYAPHSVRFHVVRFGS